MPRSRPPNRLAINPVDRSIQATQVPTSAGSAGLNPHTRQYFKLPSEKLKYQPKSSCAGWPSHSVPISLSLEIIHAQRSSPKQQGLMKYSLGSVVLNSLFCNVTTVRTRELITSLHLPPGRPSNHTD